jgi:TMEM175 potassium channel family protein
MCEFCAPWYDATRAAHVNIALKHKDMSKGRLEAFSDGVIAILITIMVLDLRVPHETSLAGLRPVIPTFFSYVLSYVFIGIYWNNHHHLLHVLHAAQRVNGAILWANLHLLFWLSLVPFATAWMGQNQFAPVTVAVYGVALLMAALAFTILARALIACNGADSPIAIAIGSDRKAKASLAIYAAAIVCTRVNPWISVSLYVLVAVIWFVPDRRIERMMA